MKTAVEWLISQLNKQGFAQVVTDEEIQKAKEMEKEQMIEFAKYTEFIDTEKSDMNKVIDFYLTLDGEEFVEETFKSE
jgi:predicted GNAT family acetyltransferase